MPLHTRYVEAADVFVEFLEGEILLDDAKAMKLQEIESSYFGPRTGILCVVHDVQFDRQLIREFAPWLREAYGDLDPRAAYLITGRNSAALMIMLQNAFRDRPVEVFSTLDAAVRWLGRDPDVCTAEVLGIDDVF